MPWSPFATWPKFACCVDGRASHVCESSADRNHRWGCERGACASPTFGTTDMPREVRPMLRAVHDGNGPATACPPELWRSSTHAPRPLRMGGGQAKRCLDTQIKCPTPLRLSRHSTCLRPAVLWLMRHNKWVSATPNNMFHCTQYRRSPSCTPALRVLMGGRLREQVQSHVRGMCAIQRGRNTEAQAKRLRTMNLPLASRAPYEGGTREALHNRRFPIHMGGMAPIE